MRFKDREGMGAAGGNGVGALSHRLTRLQPLALPFAAAVTVSGLSRSAIYRAAGRGDIVLLKHGRSTLVDMDSVRRFLATLPRASIRAPRGAPEG